MRKLSMLGTLVCVSLGTSAAWSQEAEKDKEKQYPQQTTKPATTPEKQKSDEKAYVPSKKTGTAQPETAATVETGMKPMKPGEETRALLPIAIDARWFGKIAEGAMKEGSPEMATNGRMDCSWTAGNLWLTCNLTEKMGKGKEAITWKGVLTLGYDYLNKEYRATVVDNFGGSSIMSGTIDGNKLTLTSLVATKVDGEECRGRITFDWTDPKSIKFTSEQAKGTEDYKPFEEATLRPTKKERLPGPAVS